MVVDYKTLAERIAREIAVRDSGGSQGSVRAVNGSELSLSMTEWARSDADYRTGRLPDDRIGIGAETAEDSGGGSAADREEVGAFGGSADRRGWIAGFDADIGFGMDERSEALQFLAGGVGLAECDVQQGQLCAELVC